MAKEDFELRCIKDFGNFTEGDKLKVPGDTETWDETYFVKVEHRSKGEDKDGK